MIRELILNVMVDWSKRVYDRGFSSKMTREQTELEKEENAVKDFKHHRYQKSISSEVLGAPQFKQTVEDEFQARDMIPNSKKMRQKDLQELYTGPQIKAGEKFAQMFTALTITLTYSTGLPLMYFILTLYYLFAYWFNKIMLMRYYQKTYEFNESMTINSISSFKFAIFIHMCTSIWKLSNH
jgi:hypothetical protein